MSKITKLNIFEIFLVFLAIMFKYLINISVSRKYLYLLLVFMILMIVILIFSKRMTKNQLFRAFIILIIALIFTIYYEDVNFLISLILATLCINKKDDSYIKVFFYSSLILYLLTIFLNAMNIIPSHDMFRLADGTYKIRHSLGFTHPNEVFLYFLPIVLTGYYLYWDKRLFRAIVLIASIVLYTYSFCRTGFVAVIILYIIDFLSKKKDDFKLINKIVPSLFIIFTLLSVIIAIKFGDNLTNPISSLLSGRPYYWNYYIKNNLLITFLGNNRVEGFFLDSFYMYLLVQLGLAGFAVYLYTYYKSLCLMKFNKKYSIIIVTFLIYGLFEANVIIGSIQFLYALQLREIILGGGQNGKKLERKEISN